jgi:hypothetical protein
MLIVYTGLKYLADLSFIRTLIVFTIIFLVALLPGIALVNWALDVDLVRTFGLYQL